MHVVNNPDEGTQRIEELSKQIVDQTLAAAVGYQEAFRSFAKARFAFYCAGVVFGLNMAQAALTPFVDKKE